MDNEIVYPELPPGYVWRKPGEKWKNAGVIGISDADVMRPVLGGDYYKEMVAYVSGAQPVIVAPNGNHRPAIEKREVPTFQDGVYLLASLIWMGEIQ